MIDPSTTGRAPLSWPSWPSWLSWLPWFLLLLAGGATGLAAQEVPPLDSTARGVLQLRQWKAEVLAEEASLEPPPLPSLASIAEGEEVDRHLEEICIQLEILSPPRETSGETLGAAVGPTLRGWLRERRRELEVWRADRQHRLAEAQRLANRIDLTDPAAWALALGELETVLERREDRWIAHLELGYQRLAELKRLRRRLRPEASAELDDRLRDGLGRQVESELREIPDQLMLRVLRLAGFYDRMMGEATRLSWLRQQLVLSAELVVLLLSWSLVRARIGRWLAGGLRLFEARRQELYRADTRLDRWSLEGGLATLADPAAPMMVCGIDFSAILILQVFFLRHLPLVGLVGLFVLVLLAGRVVVRGVELAVVTPTDSRPGLLVVSETGKTALISSLRWAVGLLLVFSTLRYLVRRVFDADGLAILLTSVALVAGVVYAVWMLARWQGALRWRASLLAGDGMARWIGGEAGRLGALVRAAVAGGYLVVLGPLRLLARWFGHRRELSWLGEAMARQDLDEGRSVGLPLEEGQRRAILEVEPRPMAHPVALKKLVEAFEDWRQEGRRGLALVLGDEGMGKSHFLAWAAGELATGELATGQKDGADAEALEVVHLRPPRRLEGAGPALVWLAEGLGLAPGDGETEGAAPGSEALETLDHRLRQHLETYPPTVFAIDDLQFLMLRTVGGFDALQAVLSVLLGAAERHFWLVSFHQPSWVYLRDLAIDIAEDMFRVEIELLPWTAEQLREWLEDRTRRAGFIPVYDRLLRWGVLRRETAGPALQRAMSAYWRLLVERSHGNPEIAKAHWLDSLCRSRSEKRLAVTLFDLPATRDLSQLDDDELFVLTALAIHGCLTTDQLAKVLNLSLPTVVVACRHLAGLGILDRSGDHGFASAPRWRMSIHRYLRQKNFLFGA